MVYLIRIHHVHDSCCLAFYHSINWALRLVEGIYHSADLNSFYVSFVQFSGLKQSKQHYTPGKNGLDTSQTSYQFYSL